jgi:hypothetical protein
MNLRDILVGVATGIAVMCAIGWFHEHRELGMARQALVADTLDPIAEMLKENEAISRELESGDYAEPGNDFVSAYLLKIRRDGVSKHADVKQRIDRVINNNTAILALLAKYSTHARTPAFKASAERFRDYAISLRDRWQSLPEIYMAGGNLPATGPMFPEDFSTALAAEAR